MYHYQEKKSYFAKNCSFAILISRVNVGFMPIACFDSVLIPREVPFFQFLIPGIYMHIPILTGASKLTNQ